MFFHRLCFTDILMLLLCSLFSLGPMWFWWLNVSMIDNFRSFTVVAYFYIFFCWLCFCFIFFITLSKNVYIVLIPLISIKLELFNCTFYDIFASGDYLFGLVCFWVFYCLFLKIFWYLNFSYIDYDIILYPIFHIFLYISTYGMKYFSALFHKSKWIVIIL